VSTSFRARLARSGRQEYETGPEFREASEVFHADSLATLDNVRVQVSHASGAPAVGYVQPGSHGRASGPDGEAYLTATLVITDAATIADIRTGKISGISMGYNTEHVIRDGRKFQTRIRFDHCALLRQGVERPRCGEHCSVQKDRQDMTTRVTDAIQLDGTAACACGGRTDAEAIERDRIAAMLDHATHTTGVHRDAIIGEMVRVHGGDAEITRERINDAAARLARPGSYTHSPSTPAVYTNGLRGRADAARGAGLMNDDAFRAHLAKQREDRSDADDDSDDHGRADTRGAGLMNDEGFRASLAARLDGAPE
jgi:hypothetical protein